MTPIDTSPAAVEAMVVELERRGQSRFEQNKDFGRKGAIWALETEIEWQAATLLRSLSEERDALREALSFYADPGTYHACTFLFDSPTGGFDEDFDLDHGDPEYDRPMPGKVARQALTHGETR